jgi:hypothetical protein
MPFVRSQNSHTDPHALSLRPCVRAGVPAQEQHVSFTVAAAVRMPKTMKHLLLLLPHSLVGSANPPRPGVIEEMETMEGAIDELQVRPRHNALRLPTTQPSTRPTTRRVCWVQHAFDGGIHSRARSVMVGQEWVPVPVLVLVLVLALVLVCWWVAQQPA